MNIVEKCQKILRLFLFGARDALQGTVVILKLDETNELKKAEKKQMRVGSVLEQRRRERLQEAGLTQAKNEIPKIWKRVVECCFWNGGIFLASLLIFEYILLPNLQYFASFIFGNLNGDNFYWSFMINFLSWFISAFWILPLFLISKVLNTFWFQDIADEAYRVQRGRVSNQHKISDSLSDTVFSLVMQSLFLVQSFICCLLPFKYLRLFLQCLHVSILYGFYAFEYRWINQGWLIQKRKKYTEQNWPYFIGFGSPLTFITLYFSNAAVSGCIFSLFFPLFILSANEAKPIEENLNCELPFFKQSAALTNYLLQKFSPYLRQRMSNLNQ